VRLWIVRLADMDVCEMGFHLPARSCTYDSNLGSRHIYPDLAVFFWEKMKFELVEGSCDGMIGN